MFIRRSKEGSFPSFLRETFFTFRQWRMWFLLGVVIAAYLINIKLAVALNDCLNFSGLRTLKSVTPTLTLAF